MNRLSLLFIICSLFLRPQAAGAQDDIWRRVELGEVDYQKERNYCVRLFCYYRYSDDGVSYLHDREEKDFEMGEGICQIDIRYSRDTDDGALVLASRDLVHSEQSGAFMSFFELKPYTFLEKARRDSRGRFTLQTRGDTTLVSTRRGLAGTAVRDTARRELRMNYNALAPDTAQSLSLLGMLKARLKNVQAEAVYHLAPDEVADYVPQGNLKHAVFDGDGYIELEGMGIFCPTFIHEHAELYVDSVVYLTRTEFKADRKRSAAERRQLAGYTKADIDRLKQKLGVPPLTPEQRQHIDDQRDWDDQFELWERTSKSRVARFVRGASTVAESDAMKEMSEKLQPIVEPVVDQMVEGAIKHE